MRPACERCEFHSVSPARLAFGKFVGGERTEEEGDIVASYSGDRIGMQQPIRRPFTWRGSLWVCTSVHGPRGTPQAEAYRLIESADFRGAVQSYTEKTLDSASARDDPFGFYHGMIVTCRGHDLVLAGPPARFAAREEQEYSLFASIEQRASQAR